jgi:hypothetical protein
MRIRKGAPESLRSAVISETGQDNEMQGRTLRQQEDESQRRISRSSNTQAKTEGIPSLQKRISQTRPVEKNISRSRDLSQIIATSLEVLALSPSINIVSTELYTDYLCKRKE